jgi:hypothetical protein
MKKYIFTTILFLFGIFGTVSAQSRNENANRQSARSDKLTGGTIEKTVLQTGDADLKITVNVPAFQLTLWQNGKEVKTYWVGVGMKDYPIYIGLRRASAVIWNPTWIPPNSEWVTGHKGVKVGEVIKPTDPRNPIGKMKIPLGDGFLIHQAKGLNDLGNLVSHGCVRMMKADLYDLGEKIVAARSLPVSAKQIAVAKLNLKTLTADVTPPVPVEITYDTQVVEAGRLHIYPDVYDRQTNTVANLRAELESSGVDSSRLKDKTLEQMMTRATAKKQLVVSVKSLKSGVLTTAQSLPVVMRGSAKSTNRAAPKRRAAR